MTAKELRAAAERTRAWYLDCVNHGVALTEFEIGNGELATAYLAEHREDDDEPVTEEWLQSVGAAFQIGVEGRLYRYTVHGGFLHVCGVFGRATSLTGITTRGHVRRLCECLGIELADTRGMAAKE